MTSENVKFELRIRPGLIGWKTFAFFVDSLIPQDKKFLARSLKPATIVVTNAKIW